jgi:putative phosphoesterase
VLIGVISDTHGLMRPEALAALRGVDRIIHAGDIGAPEILTALAAIAPVTAVRGNNDKGPWALEIPPTAVVDAAGVLIYVIHDVGELDGSISGPLAPRSGERGPRHFNVVVAGHSHRARNELRDGVLWFNPGSAGPRRFNLPIAVGRLTIEAGQARGEIITLTVAR